MNLAFKAGAATVALFLLSASAAAAQAPSRPPPTETAPRFGASGYTDRLTNRALELDREGNPILTEQEKLIQRVTPLIEQGRCNAAREIARQEGDRALSRRISQVCVEGRPTPIPEAEATPAG